MLECLVHVLATSLLIQRPIDVELESTTLDSIDLKIGTKILSSSLPHNTLKKVIQLQF